jgi:hypothetical protein
VFTLTLVCYSAEMFQVQEESVKIYLFSN